MPNKNLFIKSSGIAHFWNNLHQVHSKPKYLKAKIILKSLRARKPKDLNRIVIMG
jgi:hypothetical protein